jgi:oligopeptide/dipeptide ABC transporter ATP-binding protein
LSSQIIQAVRNVSFKISAGETLAIVGETGSGKSTCALSLLGLLGYQAHVESGEILFEGRSLRQLKSREWKSIRGRKIGMTFQDASGALNPILSIEDHLIETLRAHQKLSKKRARIRALEILHEVGISKGKEKLYPFELSGGASQRVGIALAICNNPRLLVADEPLSAMDAILQAHIIDLLRLLKLHYNLALLLISHDLSLIPQLADRISVMYQGRIVETGLKDEILFSPAHPYTRGLIESRPDLKHHHETRPLAAIPGTMPMPGENLPGCPFAPRCRYSEPQCRRAVPDEAVLSQTHRAACMRIMDLGDHGYGEQNK